MAKNSENIKCDRFSAKKCKFDELRKIINDRLSFFKLTLNFQLRRRWN